MSDPTDRPPSDSPEAPLATSSTPNKAAEVQSEEAASISTGEGADWQAWFDAFRQSAAPSERAYAVRVATAEWQAPLALDIAEAEDLKSVRGDGYRPSPIAVDHTLSFFRQLGPRALLSDQAAGENRAAGGLILAELAARGLVERTLVVCAPGTLATWREELTGRFGIVPFTPTRSTKDWNSTRGCWVVTWDQLADHGRELKDFGTELLIVDEAHRVTDDEAHSTLTSLVNSCNPTWRVLLSAQPLQQGVTDLHRAMEVLNLPEQNPLGDAAAFAAEYLDGKNGRFLKKSARDAFHKAIQGSVRRTTRDEPKSSTKTKTARTTRETVPQAVPPVEKEAAYRERALSAVQELPVEDRPGYARSLTSSPWAFAYDVEQAFARQEQFAPDLRTELQKLVMDGRKFRQTGKSQMLAKIVKKATSMWRKSQSRVVVFTHHPQTLHELEKQLVSQGLGKSVAILRAGQTASNRIALRGFQADPPATPVLLATDDAAAGLEFPNADCLVNYDLPWNPVLLEQRIARVDCAGQEASKVTVHNLFLEDSRVQDILIRLYDKLGLFDAQPGETAELLQACGFADGEAYAKKIGKIFMLAAEHGDYETPLLQIVKSRKNAEKEIRDRRRAAETSLGGLDAVPPAPKSDGEAPPAPTPRVPLDALLAALLDHREQGWERSSDGKVVLHTEGGKRELSADPNPERVIAGQGDKGNTWTFAPGSSAWQELAQSFSRGNAYYLHDARDLPAGPVRAVLQRRFQEHGMVVESINVLERTAAMAGQFSFRLIAECNGERVERLFEVDIAEEEHKLDGAHKDIKNLPDAGRDPIQSLARETFEDFAPALQAASTKANHRVTNDPSCAHFVARQEATGNGAVVTTRSEPLGFKGVLYDVARIEFKVRHKDQTNAWSLQTVCVPLTGALLGELPLPAEGTEPTEMWACSAGHLVAKDEIRTCADPECEVGACATHLEESGTALKPCDDCGQLGCPEHAYTCSGCGHGLCSNHMVTLSDADGGHACTSCTATLDDGRVYLGGLVVESTVSGRKGLRDEMVQTEGGHWAFSDELHTCPVTGNLLLESDTAVDEISGERVATSELERSAVSGATSRRDQMVQSDWSGRYCLADESVRCELSSETLLPDEVETCVRSGKTVRRDRLFTDPVSGERCLEELTEVSAVSGTRTLPENLHRCARSGKPALAEELQDCSQCGARILPTEGITCSVSNLFACPDHLVACEATGDKVLPDALDRCSVSGRMVKKSLLETCPETGKKAHKDVFVTCESTGHRVLRDALALCSVSGKRVQRGLLESCAVTGRQALGEELSSCQLTGKRVLPDLLMDCPETGLRILATEAVKCEESGALCAPDGIKECTETGRKVRNSLLGVDDFTGQPVLKRLLKECKRTRKTTTTANLGVCTVSGLRVIESELSECEESERPVLPDHLAVCEATGAKVHPDQLVTCHETKRQVLRRLAERCAVTGHSAAPGVLMECAETGKKVLPGQLDIDGISGEKVLADLLVECDLASCRTLPRNLVRSAISGKQLPRAAAAQCELTGAWALPEELETCSVSGKTALPEQMESCQATGDRVLKENLAVCESTGKRVRKDRLRECPRSGQTVLADLLVPSPMSGEIGLRTLLVACEFSRKRVFPDELGVSEISAKSYRKDREAVCVVSGRKGDMTEIKECACCGLQTGIDLMPNEVCPTCMTLIGQRSGHSLTERDLATVQNSHPWAKKPIALESTGALHVYVAKARGLRRRDALMLVFRREEGNLQLTNEVVLEPEIVTAFVEAAKNGGVAPSED